MGIEIQINPQEYGFWIEQVHSNDHDALVWGSGPRDTRLFRYEH